MSERPISRYCPFKMFILSFPHYTMPHVLRGLHIVCPSSVNSLSHHGHIKITPKLLSDSCKSKLISLGHRCGGEGTCNKEKRHELKVFRDYAIKYMMFTFFFPHNKIKYVLSGIYIR